MENVYKIRVRSEPDPKWLYPSERRYSASTVLGLGVVHLSLAFTALLLSSLSLTTQKFDVKNVQTNETFFVTKNEDFNTPTNTSESIQMSNQEAQFNNSDVGDSFTNNANLTMASCIMSLGSLAAGLSGLLAWKRWYIDRNIKWFFYMSFVSTTTSLVSLIVTALTVISTGQFNDLARFDGTHKPNLRLMLTVNVCIASLLSFLWSLLSSKIAWNGVKAAYPDDIFVPKSRGRIQVNTVHKGNKKCKIIPPDILNHFPINGKLLKYFPKKEPSNLPKEESNLEYQERVNKFLASQTDSGVIK